METLTHRIEDKHEKNESLSEENLNPLQRSHSMYTIQNDVVSSVSKF